MSRFSKWFTEFRQNFWGTFLRWTPAFALLSGVSAIIGLTVAQALLHHGGWRIAYFATGAAALVLLALGLWPVRRYIPHILGLQAEFPQLHKNNETRPT